MRGACVCCERHAQAHLCRRTKRAQFSRAEAAPFFVLPVQVYSILFYNSKLVRT